MSDFEEECDFQAPINVPVDIYTRKRNRCQIEDDKYVETEQDLTEVSTCSLCQTCWTNNGAHGIVGLKCGHVFGRSCIVQHMRDATAQKTPAKCPTCDNPLAKSEPRRIWPNKVLPCDETDLIDLRKQHAEADLIIQGLKEANEAIQQQIDKAIFDHLVLQAEDRSNRIISPSQIMQMSQPSIFVHQRSFSKKNEKYRVMDVDPMGDRAVVSVWKEQKYGIRKMNLYDITSTEFIPNHSGIIKDLKYSTEDMVLSTGLDKTLKLTSLQSNQVVLSYQLGAPGWSCASSEANPSIVYCGLTSNTVLVFDIRNTKEFVHKLIEPCVPKIFSPIHSIMEVMTEDVPLLLCSNLSHTYGWNTSTEEYEYVPLQQSVEYENNLTDQYKSFSMANRDGCLLSSLRNKTSTRYEVSHFDTSLQLQSDWHYDDIDHKQTSLSRNTLFKSGEQTFICFSDNDTVKIRDKTMEVQRIKAKGPVADIKYIEEGQVLTILTEDELCLYKFAPPEIIQ